MSIRLKPDVLLAAGATTSAPVDLVCRSTRQRLPLSSEEAAVAMLLIDGVEDAASLYALARLHDVHWDPATARAFIERLWTTGLLLAEEGEPEEFDDSKTIVEPVRLYAESTGPKPLSAPPREYTGPKRPSPLAPPREYTGPARPPAPQARPLPPPREHTGPARPPAPQARPLPPPREHTGPRRSAAPPPPSAPDFVTEVDIPVPPPSAAEDAPRWPSAPRRAPPAPAAAATITQRSVPLPEPAPPRRPPLRPGVPESPLPARLPTRTPTSVSAPIAFSSTGEQMRPLAAAAMMVCEQRHAEAKALLLAFLGEEPGNVQAQAMLDLVDAQLGPKPGSRHVLRIALAVAAALLVGLVAVTLLIKVPTSTRLPCQASSISVGSVAAPAAGKVASVAVRVGQTVEPAQLVALISDPSGQTRLPALREELASQQELLRIMRTGGTDADARSLKKRMDALVEERERVTSPETAALDRSIAMLKTKLRFCEWQALPKEIADAAAKVDALRRELKNVGAGQRQEVRSPSRGRVQSIVGEGEQVTKGALIAKLIDSSHVMVTANLGRAAPPTGEPAEVTLADRSFSPLVQTAPVGGRLSLQLNTDSALVASEATPACSIRLRIGSTSLLRSLLRGDGHQ